MPFFAELPDDPPEPEQRPVHYDYPNDRPQHWAPGSAALAAVVGRSVDTVVHVRVGGVYPRGLSWEVMAFLSPDGPEIDHLRMHHRGGGSGRLRLGLEVSDGRRVETEDDWHPIADRRRDSGDLHLALRGGGGGGITWSWDAWMWPLPPPGPATFYCRWDDRGIAETATPVDLTEVVAAADRAEELWSLPVAPDPGTGEGFGWMSYSPLGGFSTFTATGPDTQPGDGSGDALDGQDEDG